MGSATAEVDLLERADGSGRYRANGFEVVAAVNGPVEVQRRDELPEEAAIDVIVRPAAGVAAIRERHFESLIHRVLGQTIRTQAHPRTLIQVTLQVTSTPDTDSANGKLPQAASNLALLPVLLNAALLALLTSTIPLKTTYTATVLAIDQEKDIVDDVTPEQVHGARSIHVVCLNRAGETILAESEGRFKLEEWASVVEHARALLLEEADTGDTSMDLDRGDPSGLGLIRKTITARLEKHEAWRRTV